MNKHSRAGGKTNRGIAQFGRVRGLGPRCRRFESCCPDQYADVAELADALDSGSSGSDTVGVQVPSSAPNQYNPNLFPIGSGFGLFVFFDRYETTYFRNGVKRKKFRER